MSYSQLLAGMFLFESLPAEELENLSMLLRPRRHPRGEVIFHQGDVGRCLYIIRKGQVVIRLSSGDGKEAILALLARGDFFGELALLDDEPHSTDAVAREDVELLILQREGFRRFLEERPHLAMKLLPSLTRLMRHVTRLVHDATFLDARTRLARVLLDLARQQGQPGATGVVISERLTQSELASLCGLTRESTNRWLRFYVRQGLLSYEKGRITLVKPERLGLEAE